MRVLVIDDDPIFLDMLCLKLERDDYEVEGTTSGINGIRLARTQEPDVIILDIKMPDLDGIQTCQRLRQITDAPIIFLSVLDGEEDIVRGLNFGADDYLCKPPSLVELEARLEAMRRRAGASAQPDAMVYDDGCLRVDLRAGQVILNGQPIGLSPKEFSLLACLVRRADKMVPYLDILQDVWGPGYESENGYLSLYVYYLRQKLGEDATDPRYIVTYHRQGYGFATQEGE